MQKKKRTALEATIDVVGRDQQDQILYLKKDPETQIWNLERMEMEPHKEPPEPCVGSGWPGWSMPVNRSGRALPRSWPQRCR